MGGGSRIEGDDGIGRSMDGLNESFSDAQGDSNGMAGIGFEVVDGEVYPYLICAFCNRPIQSAEDGYVGHAISVNSPYFRMYRTEAVFLHKGHCDAQWHAQHGTLHPKFEIEPMLARLLYNLGLHGEPEGLTETRFREDRE